MFTQKDLRQIADKGVRIDEINRQIKYFQKGFPPADITMTATPGKGIIVLSEGDERHYKDIFLNNAPDFRITRFIPASGAATRMFKSLFETLENLEGLPAEEQQKIVKKQVEIKHFFKNLERYPFFEDLELPEDASPAEILKRILGEEGLNYAGKPKGLLKFHKYGAEDRRSSFEEHLWEAAMYCGSRQKSARIHLTVSPAHLDGFQAEAARIIPRIENKTGFQIDLSFSFQKPETDTIAVDPDDEPFRNPDGTLLFRPGGHGALIRNLDALDSDMVFISNIDNVAPDRIKNTRMRYKQVLGGLLLEIRSKLSYYLQQLTSGEKLERTRLDAFVTYLHERLGMAIPEKLASWDAPELIEWLIETMNRPIRVCGMVRNEGEPVGWSFYVRSVTCLVRLRFVEFLQIDLEILF